MKKKIIKNKKIKKDIFLRFLIVIIITLACFAFLLSYENFHNSKNKYINNFLNIFKNKKILENKKYNTELHDEKKIDGKLKHLIQIGIYVNNDSVDNIRARLILLGFDVNKQNYIYSGKSSTKVTLGPYSKDKLMRSIKILKDNDIQHIIIDE